MATYGFGIIDSTDADHNKNAYVRRVRPLAASDADIVKAGRGSTGGVIVIIFPDKAAVDAWYADPD